MGHPIAKRRVQSQRSKRVLAGEELETAGLWEGGLGVIHQSRGYASPQVRCRDNQPSEFHRSITVFRPDTPHDAAVINSDEEFNTLLEQRQ
jgi:hypothetical protein